MAVQQEIIDADKKPPYISNFQKQKLQQVTSNDIESIYEQSSISTQDVENEPAVNENQKSNWRIVSFLVFLAWRKNWFFFFSIFFFCGRVTPSRLQKKKTDVKEKQNERKRRKYRNE